MNNRGDQILPTLQAERAADITRTSEPNQTTKPASDAPLNATGQPRDRTRYEILGEHGRGGIGSVSRAHDRELGRDVAIKELIARDDVHEVRFLREALITARLEHPSIVPVHEAGRWPDGTPFYAMKLVAGRPLRDLIAERTTVEQRIALLHHVIAVADAMAYAHGRNIIHRDLKPSNIIVGDFGETVVIDWGLAKDLSSDDGPSSGASLSLRRDSDLTVTGSVLGTPAYMAPEQERGEHVDQRADVFAIGAMLWELCTLHKLPPRDEPRRHRILRSAGIDRDLVTIIEKALAPNPEDRYPNAGALATDLKAFKSGARITARDYSLLATLAHWMRRHRALAISAAAATALGLAGIALYVRNIAIERDRADAALREARAANTAAVTANSNLVLKNAELLLASDPSAAWDALTDYRGPDQPLAQLLRAKAKGLGIAKIRVSAHKATIYHLYPLANGTLLSISEDGTIVTTTTEGTSTVLARNAGGDDVSAFSARRGLLAYACQPNALCLLDTARHTNVVVSASEPDAPASLDFSPDDDQLAVRRGDRIDVWRIDTAAPHRVRQVVVPDAKRVQFASDRHLVVAADHHVHLIDLASGSARMLDATATVVTSDDRIALLGAADGEIHAIAVRDWPRLSWTQAVCHGRINAIAMLRSRHAFTYACQDGNVGIRDLDEPKQLIAHYHQDNTVLSLVASADDHYIVTGGASGRMRIYDLASEILTHYNGQLTRLDAVSGPTPAFPYFASGDDDGYLRIWDIPLPAARTAFRARAPLYDLNFLDRETVVAVGEEGVLYAFRAGVSSQRPVHATGGFRVTRSPDNARFATLGFDGTVAVWDSVGLSQLQRLVTGPPTDVNFLDDRTVLTSGEDGRLLAWTLGNDKPELRAQFSRAVSAIEALSRDHTLLVAEYDGAITLLSDSGRTLVRRIREPHGDQVNALVSSDDQQWVVALTTSGQVLRYDTRMWTETQLMKAGGAIRSFALSPDKALMSAVSEDGFVYLLPFAGGALPQGEPHWSQLALPARSLRFSPDGSVLAITTSDGGVCFYTVKDRAWHYVAYPGIDVFFGRFSTDGRTYVTSDSTAHVVLLDMATLLN